MCKVKDNEKKTSHVKGNIIDQIVEEYYDPNILPLTEEELEEISEEYGNDTNESILDRAIFEEYYDPSVTPLSKEELEELLFKYGDYTFWVNNENAKEVLEYI